MTIPRQPKSPRGPAKAADRPAGLLTSAEACRALPSAMTGKAVHKETLAEHWKSGTLTPAAVVKGRPYWDLDDLISQWRRKVSATVSTPAAVLGRKRGAVLDADTLDADALDLIHQKTLLTREQCRLAELKRKEHEGSLISLPAVTLAWQSIAIALRDTLMGLGGRLADDLVGILDPRQIRTMLDTEVRAALVSTDAALGASVARLRAGGGARGADLDTWQPT